MLISMFSMVASTFFSHGFLGSVAISVSISHIPVSAVIISTPAVGPRRPLLVFSLAHSLLEVVC